MRAEQRAKIFFARRSDRGRAIFRDRMLVRAPSITRRGSLTTISTRVRSAPRHGFVQES
jgi:hypothetical protein